MPICFDLEIDKKIAVLTLNRPEKYNSMIKEFWTELPEAIEKLRKERQARVLVILSEGKHFCSGMDISVFAQEDSLRNADTDRYAANEAFREHVSFLQKSFSCLEDLPFPVLVGCQGGVIGGAMDMISAADCRYATENAFFCIEEINIGMTADVGSFPRLCKQMPDGWLRELAYSGMRMGADKAKQMGFVNEIFANEEVMCSYIMELAEKIAQKNPIAITGTKRMINYARDHSIADGLDYIATWQSGMFAPEHIAESFGAKMEKRAPNYPDLLPLKKSV